MRGSSVFKSYIDKLGVDWEDVLSSGLSLFIKEQDPDKVVYKVHTDSDENITGYSIQVKTDEENVKEAKDFWENHVEPKLNG
jgi:hypothetical protein